MKRITITLLALVAMFAIRAIADDKPTTQPATQPSTQHAAINKMCAVEHEDPIDASVTIDYKGKTIGFCCKDCIAKFKAEYKAEPFSLAAYGYNALYLAKHVIEKAGAPDREKIRAAFETTQNFPTVLGAKGTTFSFSAKQRAGFPDKGAVMRLIENNQHGKAIFSGY